MVLNTASLFFAAGCRGRCCLWAGGYKEVSKLGQGSREDGEVRTAERPVLWLP